MRRHGMTCLLVALSMAPGLAVAASQFVHAGLTGAQVVPPNGSVATGTCDAIVNTSTLQVTFNGAFASLAAPPTSITIRGLASPGAVAPVLLVHSAVTAATTGTFSGGGSLTVSQIAGMLGGQTYCEIDNPFFPSGEIRGQLTQVAPALPGGTIPLLFLTLAGIGLALGRSRRMPTSRGAETR